MNLLINYMLEKMVERIQELELKVMSLESKLNDDEEETHF